MAEEDRLGGFIDRLITDRGFGFIKGLDGKRYFFHASECDYPFDSLSTGDQMSFEITPSPKGPKAVKVQFLGEGPRP